MKLFGKKYEIAEDVLRDAPGPSPWYLRFNPPVLPIGYSWAEGEEGTYYITNEYGKVVAVLGMYCYSLTLENRRLLVWWEPSKSRTARNDSSTQFEFRFLELEKLSPIDDPEEFAKGLRAEGKYIYCAGDNPTTFSIPIALAVGENSIQYPIEFENIGELLLLGQTTVFKDAAGNHHTGLCLFELRPSKASVAIFPQDWFNNNPEIDYGYQWVTCVARSSKTGRIFGEGFRISRFVLDESSQRVEKWFVDDPFYGNMRKH